MKNYILIYLLLISFLTPQSECDCEEPVTGECDEKLYTYIFIIDKFFDTTIGM